MYLYAAVVRTVSDVQARFNQHYHSTTCHVVGQLFTIPDFEYILFKCVRRSSDSFRRFCWPWTPFSSVHGWTPRSRSNRPSSDGQMIKNTSVKYLEMPESWIAPIQSLYRLCLKDGFVSVMGFFTSLQACQELTLLSQNRRRLRAYSHELYRGAIYLTNSDQKHH